MNFAFSEEQEELRRAVRQFLESKSPETEVRRLMETTEGYDPAVWKQMGQELMLQGLAIPEEYGGQGFTFIGTQGAMVTLIAIAFLMTALAIPLITFLPVFAKQVFHQGVGEYTRLMAFSGFGSVVGAMAVAWLGKYNRMGRTALIVQALCGLLIAGFALSRVLWLSDTLLFFTGAALMVVFATVTSLVQLVVPDELRGRVMSIYMVAFRGGMPMGSLVSGYFASKFGAPVVLICNGILLVAVATYFMLRSHGVREL